MADALDCVSSALFGLTMGASLVLAPERALVVLVYADGQVENRVFVPPKGQTQSQMREAINFLNAVVQGKALGELKKSIESEIFEHRHEIDTLTAALLKSGVAVLENESDQTERLVVRGRSNLLDQGETEQDLLRVRQLFDDLERKRDIAEFLDLTERGDDVRIFIGSENKLFSFTGSSLVVSSYMDSERKVIGAVGVIGPKRLNYGRIVPLVNYTAQTIGRFYQNKDIEAWQKKQKTQKQTKRTLFQITLRMFWLKWSKKKSSVKKILCWMN